MLLELHTNSVGRLSDTNTNMKYFEHLRSPRITVVATAAMCYMCVLHAGNSVHLTEILPKMKSLSDCGIISPKRVEVLFFHSLCFCTCLYTIMTALPSICKWKTAAEYCRNCPYAITAGGRRERGRKGKVKDIVAFFLTLCLECILSHETGDYRCTCDFVVGRASMQTVSETDVPNTWPSIGLIHVDYKSCAIYRRSLNSGWLGGLHCIPNFV